VNILAQSVDDVSKIATGNYTTTGVLLLIILGVAFAAWRFSSWAGKHVDLVVARVIQHLDVVETTMRSFSTALDSQGEVLTSVESKLDAVSKRVDDLDRHIVASRREQG
jgi:hypothetical protein